MYNSGFFNAKILSNGSYDRSYNASQFASVFKTFIRNGVNYGVGNNLEVVPTDPTKMAVVMKSGRIWIDGYWFENENDYLLEVDVADGTLHRDDAVCIELNLATREVRPFIKKGNFYSSDGQVTKPIIENTISSKQMFLAMIHIGPAAVSITSSMITDLRDNTDYCGIAAAIFDEAISAKIDDFYKDASNKVDKVDGKGLSANDFTNELLNKLNGIDENANAYVHPAPTTVRGSNFYKISVDSLGHINNVEAVEKSDITGFGIPELDEHGLIPASQLPSFVDDVIEGTLKSDGKFYKSDGSVIAGEVGKIYVNTANNKTYRFAAESSTYVVISDLDIGDLSTQAGRGDWTKAAYDHATAKGAAFTSGFYKITTNAQGHVTAVTQVTKADITALGIPGENTWRGIQDNLESDSTEESLSAKQGKILNEKIEQAVSKTNMLKEAEGTNIRLTDSGNAPLQEFKIYGKSEQVTTAGKNLLPLQEVNTTTNGVTCTTLKDNSGNIIGYKLNGTATAQNTFSIHAEHISTKNGLYVQGSPSGSSSSTYNIMITYYNDNGTWQSEGYVPANGILKVGTNYPKFKLSVFVRTNVTLNNIIFQPMLSTVSTVTSFEPYTGGAPSPSPEYPQEIIDAVEPVVASGYKDIWDSENTGKINQGYVLPERIVNEPIYQKVKPNTKYILTCKGSSTVGFYFSAISFNRLDKSQICICSRTGDNSLNVIIKGYEDFEGGGYFNYAEFTTPPDCYYIRVGALGTLSKIELKEYTTSTIPYTLRSIGDVKDELIVRADGTGRFIQRIGAYTITGKEDWTQYNGVWYINVGFNYSLASGKLTCKSDRYNATYNIDGGAVLTNNNDIALLYDATQPNLRRVYIRDNEHNSDLSTYLKSNNVHLIYVLATPITTELSKEQVNTILNGLQSYKPTTVITNNYDTNMEIHYFADNGVPEFFDVVKEEINSQTSGSASSALQEANKYSDGILTQANNYSDGKLREANNYSDGILDSAKSYVNMLQVGGDNLLVGLDNWMSNATTCTITSNRAYDVDGSYISFKSTVTNNLAFVIHRGYILPYTLLNSGVKLTLTFSIHTTSNVPVTIHPKIVRVPMGSSPEVICDFGTLEVPASTQSNVFGGTVQFEGTGVLAKGFSNDYDYLTFYGIAPSACTVSIMNLKLEVGEKSTQFNFSTAELLYRISELEAAVGITNTSDKLMRR